MKMTIMYFFLFLLHTILSTKNNLDIEHKIKKVQACNILSRVRLATETEYIKHVAQFVDPNSSEQESIQRLASLLLLTCLKKISSSQVDILHEVENPESINPMTKEYKSLLEVEKWEEVFQSNNDKLIGEEINKYAPQMKEIRSVQDYMDLNDEEQKPRTKQQANKEVDEEPEEDFTQARYKPETNLNLFGVDIENLSSNTKLIIGLSLLVLLGAVIVVASKNAISALPATKQKVSKKKKKDKES
jgi:hypothetical protein